MLLNIGDGVWGECGASCLANTPASGGTCGDPDPNTARHVDYLCPIGYSKGSALPADPLRRPCKAGTTSRAENQKSVVNNLES